MKALVVYESMFGNTEEVAQAIARGLSEHLDVGLVEVSTAPPVITEPLDLIVVGGPTHGFWIGGPFTRADAIRVGAGLGAKAVGVR
jgi:flavodoxin